MNLTMRLIAPVLRAVNNSRSSLPSLWSAPDIVAIKPSAEARDISEVQSKAKKLVWASGCTSWFIEPSTGRNSIMFPDWQYRFWIRTVFIAWNDFSYTQSRNGAANVKRPSLETGSIFILVTGLAVGMGIWACS